MRLPYRKYLAAVVGNNSGAKINIWQIEKLDKLLQRGCSWLKDYLKNNSSVRDRDRALCKNINPGK